MADIETQIDVLYQLPPAEFTSARTALAKTLSGEQARQVRGLKKPTAVPWAVNQVYWKARSVYDAAMKAGQSLRTAQIATLKGKKADVRAATDAHRRAIAAAVHQGVRNASTAGLKPSTEQLARMFEAVSLAAAPPSAPGRFVEVVAPSGFDALTGVTPAKRVQVSTTPADEKRAESAVAPKLDRAAERRRLEQEHRERREAEGRLRTAARELEHARARVQTAREALEHAEADVEAAERTLAEARARSKAL